MAAKQSNQTVVPAGENRAGDGTDAAVKPQPVRQPIPTPIPAPGVFESDVALRFWVTFEFILTANAFAAIDGSFGSGSSEKSLENFLASAVAKNLEAIAKLLAREKGKTFRVQCNFVPPILDEWKTPINELVSRLAAGKSASVLVGEGRCVGELSPFTPWVQHKGLVQKVDSKFITDRAKQNLGDEVGRIIEDAGSSLARASLAQTDSNQNELLIDMAHFFERLQVGLDAFQVQIVNPLQEYVKRLEGKSFGYTDGDMMFAKALQKVANRLRLRILCPHCNQPAILRFHKAGRPPRGVYQFEHSAHGKKTHHGGAVTVPKIEFVEAPIDGRERH